MTKIRISVVGSEVIKGQTYEAVSEYWVDSRELDCCQNAGDMLLSAVEACQNLVEKNIQEAKK